MLIIAVIWVGELKVREASVGNSHLEGKEDEGYKEIKGNVYKIEKKEKLQYLYVREKEKNYLIYDTSFQSVRVGNEILAIGQYQLFESEPNPGNFNPKQYYATKKIEGYVWADSLNISKDEVDRVQESLSLVRVRIKSIIYQYMDDEKGGFMVALLLGEQEGLGKDNQEMFQSVGVGHIFAISGLHISILSLFVYKVLRKVLGNFFLAAILSSILLLCYVAMVGFEVSSTRASIMFLLLMGAEVSGRGYDSLTSVAIAALFILLENKRLLFDASFLLSFGAILGIFYLYPIFLSCLKKLGRFGRGVAASASIQMVLFPILLYYFYEISTYSIFTNLLILPILGVLIILGVVSVVFSFFFPMLASCCFYMCECIIAYIYRVGECAIELPFARVVLGIPENYVMVLYYGSILGMILLRIWREKRKEREVKWGWKSIMLWMCLTISLLLIEKPVSGVEVTMLNVGQGDSMYIRGPSGVDYLIDGGSSSESEVGKYRMEPFLKSKGVGKLEYVFVTHGDQDHINGIIELIKREKVGIKIDTLVMCEKQFQDSELIELKELAITYGIRVLEVRRGDVIKDGEASFTVLGPSEEYVGELGNASSLVLELEYKDFKMLCTGDIEGRGEELLIQDLIDEEKVYDVLKVAHHGSKNSTPLTLLEQIQPEIALISAGEDNPYGHPHQELLERLEKYVKNTYETANSGAIVLKYY